MKTPVRAARQLAGRAAMLAAIALTGCAVQPYHPNVQPGGRAETVAVNPANASHMLVTSETGGLFATHDGGRNWTHVGALPSFRLKGVAFAPGNPDIVIAAAQFDWRISNGPIWRSTDGGRTWTQPAGAKPAAAGNCGDRVSAYGVSFEPGSSNVYVAGDCGVSLSRDLGVTWTHVVQNPSGVARRVWSVLAQSGGRVNIAAEDGLWHSGNAGASWTKSVSGPAFGQAWVIHALGASPYEPRHLFLAAGGEKLFLSTDGGANWAQLDAPARPARPPFVRVARGGAPDGAFEVFFGHGTDTFRRTFAHGATPSASGGWRMMVATHADSADVGFDAAGKPVLLLTDGGLHRPGAERTVNLRASNDLYVVAEGGGGQPAFADRANASTWEAFYPVDVNGGELIDGDALRLQTQNRQRFLGVAGPGLAFVDATATQAGANETFVLRRVDGPGAVRSGDRVRLQASNGSYVAPRGADARMFATQPETDPATVFTWEFNEVWEYTGGGRGGYNALQITEITGQMVYGADSHHDLYYGTQDNDVVASSDGGDTWPVSKCCEGFFIHVAPESVNHDDSKVTATICWGCGNFISDAHFANQTGWRNAPGSAGSAPMLLHSTHYLQKSVDTSGPAPVDTVHLTTDQGATWAPKYGVPLEMRSVTRRAGVPAEPVLYHPVRHPGNVTTGEARIGLVKATGLYGAPVVGAADLNGLGGIGTFHTMFVNYIVYAANPSNPQQLLAADIESDSVKSSSDGGQSWRTDEALTRLVTSNGQFSFRLGDATLVSAIAWDPYAKCHILVGTAQNGVFRSANGGRTWEAVPDTAQIANLSSFYFPREGPVFASSYGRGLWLLSLDRQPVNCDLPRSIREAAIDVHELRLAGLSPPAMFDPTICRACRYIVVRNGRIRDLVMDGRQLREVVISGGSYHEFDAGGRELPPSVPNSIAARLGGFGGNGALGALAKGERPLRGVVMEGAEVKAVIVADNELPFRPGRVPYLRAFAEGMHTGMPVIKGGGVITVRGSGFAPGPVLLFLDGEPLGEKAVADARGSFSVAVTVRRAIGQHELSAEQKDGKRLAVERAQFRVVPGDEANAKRNPSVLKR